MAAQRFHIIIDASNVSEKSLSDEEGLKKFLTDLTSEIGMHVLAGPLIAQGIPQNPGLSGFVLIDFSHISIHTFIKHKQALVDIFSCQAYDKETAVKPVLEYFQIPRESARIETVSWE